MATTCGNPHAPQTSGLSNASAEGFGGCRPPLPMYPDFVRVSTSPLRPCMPAAAALSPAGMHYSVLPTCLGLTSVPTRPSLRCMSTVAATGDTSPLRLGLASDSSSTARQRSRSLRRSVLPSMHPASTSSLRNYPLDGTSDEDLRAGLLRFLQES